MAAASSIPRAAGASGASSAPTAPSSSSASTSKERERERENKRESERESRPRRRPQMARPSPPLREFGISVSAAGATSTSEANTLTRTRALSVVTAIPPTEAFTTAETVASENRLNPNPLPASAPHAFLRSLPAPLPPPHAWEPCSPQPPLPFLSKPSTTLAAVIPAPAPPFQPWRTPSSMTAAGSSPFSGQAPLTAAGPFITGGTGLLAPRPPPVQWSPDSHQSGNEPEMKFSRFG